MNYYKAQQSSTRPPRICSNITKLLDQAPYQTSKLSGLDQEINDHKRLFSSLWKEIGHTLTPEPWNLSTISGINP